MILFLLSLIPLIGGVINLLAFGNSGTNITAVDWFSVGSSCFCFAGFGYILRMATSLR